MKRIFALLIISIMILTACQPTPEEEIVIPKDFNAEEVIKAQTTDEVEAYCAPESWSETIETGINGFSIEVNAEIQIPESGQMPMATIVYKDISNEMAIAIKDSLLNGAKLYIGDGVKTREEIQAEILLEEAKFTDPNSIINVQETDEMKELKRAVVEETIKQLEEQLKTAPEVSTRSEVNQFEQYDEGVWGFEGYAQSSDNKNIEISILKYANNLRNFILYTDMDTDISLNLRRNIIWSNILLDDQKNYENLSGVEISTEEALEVANLKVLEVAGDDFNVSEIGSIKKISLYEDYYSFPQCYLFRYTRKANDAQVTYDNTIQTSGGYSESRTYESISVVVDDSGVVAFEWLAPSEIKEVLCDSVQLLAFENIQEIFLKQIVIEGIFEEDYNYESKKK